MPTGQIKLVKEAILIVTYICLRLIRCINKLLLLYLCAEAPTGIKLSYLLSVFIDEKKFSNVQVPVKDGKGSVMYLTLQLKDLTVGEFLDYCLKQFLMARTVDDIFYSDYLQKYPQNEEKIVDYAQVYIACEATSNFVNTMNTLRDQFENMPEVFIAMDRITHRLPIQIVNKEADFLIGLFEERIKQIGHVVVVMSPWNNTGFLQRTALLFEIFCALLHNCVFDIALSSYDKKSLVESLKVGGVDVVKNALEGINIGTSKCGFPAMRKKIIEHEAVRDHVTSMSPRQSQDGPQTTVANKKLKRFLIRHYTVKYSPPWAANPPKEESQRTMKGNFTS